MAIKKGLIKAGRVRKPFRLSTRTPTIYAGVSVLCAIIKDFLSFLFLFLVLAIRDYTSYVELLVCVVK